MFSGRRAFNSVVKTQKTVGEHRMTLLTRAPAHQPALVQNVPFHVAFKVGRLGSQAQQAQHRVLNA